MAKRFKKSNNKKQKQKQICPIHNVRRIRVGQIINDGVRENRYDCHRCRSERINGITINPEDILTEDTTQTIPPKEVSAKV